MLLNTRLHLGAVHAVSRIICRNNVSDAHQIEFLSLCSSMKNLTLEGNPICLAPQPGETSVSINMSMSVCMITYIDIENSQYIIYDNIVYINILVGCKS